VTDLHIGYLVQQFAPEVGAGPARVVEMARHWMRSGAEVTVITGMPNRPEGRIHADYRGRLLLEEEWEGMRVLRSWLYASPERGTLRTLLNNGTFMVSSALHGIMRAKGLDVLIASSPPFFPHVSGRLVGTVRRVPLVAEVRDLWPDYLVDMGVLSAGSAATRGLFWLERRLLRRADAVTVVTDSFRRRVIEKGVDPGRVHVMPAGVDPDFYFRSEEAPPLPALKRAKGEFLVGYLGNFGAGQELGTVVDAARLLENSSPPIRFVLVGDGPQRSALQASVAEAALRNLTIHPPIQKEWTRAFYASCDACLVPLAPVPVFQETVPSKIFEIMACERPIVASVDGEARRIMEASGGGWTTRPGDSSMLAEAILAAAQTPAEQRALMGARGRAYAIERFSRGTIAARYLSLLESVARTRGRGSGPDGAAARRPVT
jgi:glycosyltransferase involved in cell wall biosynthesis